MKLILGLGNPGAQYRGTRHNLGFATIDRLAQTLGIPLSRLKCESLLGQGVWEQETIVLAKPLTYMNLSGRAAKALLSWFRLSPEELIVVCDDLNLEPGILRLRPRGSSGGHRGLDSIIRSLGSEDFVRLRLGIGRPPANIDAADFVLRHPDPAEYEIIEEMVGKAREAIFTLLGEGVAAAMNKFNPKPGASI